ncbi:hypothetical protein V9T40_006009 [Parthenolecanium corni]|uniref:Uncharacterized protein n=1 Tax=Parthenolecanium corni TaxID=536013 RepID=A0AAN9U461_9HEMI
MEGARRIYQLLRSCPKWSPAEVQEWLGHELDPLDWGWEERCSCLVPIPSLNPPALASILDVISCTCKDCGPKCVYHSSGLKCLLMCTQCGTMDCSNRRGVESQNDYDLLSDIEDEDEDV